MKYVNKTHVPFSQTGVGEGLSVIGVAQIIEDNVCAFFAAYGIDNPSIKAKHNALWMFVKNKFQKRAVAVWNDEITVESFFTKITAATVVVDTVIYNSKGEIAVMARTEACVIDLGVQRIRRISSVEFPENIELYPSTAGFEFTRFDPPVLTEKCRFTVPSTSIDFCQHVNNVEYLRFVLNASSVEKELTCPVRETEVNFVSQARENEELSLFFGEKDGDEFYEIKSGETVVAKCRLSRGR